MTKKTKSTGPKGRIGRRTFMKGIAATGGLAAGSGMMTGFPTIWAQNIKNVTLRQFGTGVSNINEIAKKVKEDLGFTLEMTTLDTDTTAQRVVTQPKPPSPIRCAPVDSCRTRHSSKAPPKSLSAAARAVARIQAHSRCLRMISLTLA